MSDQIKHLSAIVTKRPNQSDLPDLVARVARLWAEIHTADPELAIELAQKLPETEIVLQERNDEN